MRHPPDYSIVGCRTAACETIEEVTSLQKHEKLQKKMSEAAGVERKKRKVTPLGVITGASRPRGSPSEQEGHSACTVGVAADSSHKQSSPIR